MRIISLLANIIVCIISCREHYCVYHFMCKVYLDNIIVCIISCAEYYWASLLCVSFHNWQKLLCVSFRVQNIIEQTFSCVAYRESRYILGGVVVVGKQCKQLPLTAAEGFVHLSHGWLRGRVRGRVRVSVRVSVSVRCEV